MKRKFKEINFDKNSGRFQFDCVNLEDILKRKPIDHNQFEFHKVSFYVIFLITQNGGDYNLNFKDYSFKKGSLFTLRRGNIHKFYKSRAKGKLLVFSENFIVNHANELEASKIFLLFNEMLASPKLQLNEEEYVEIVGLIALIEKEYNGVNDDYSPNIVRNYFQIIITKLFRLKSKANIVLDNNRYLSKFLELQELIEENCFNNKKVSFYADKLSITTKTLNNITQSTIQSSVKALINDIVIIQSKRLIII